MVIHVEEEEHAGAKMDARRDQRQSENQRRVRTTRLKNKQKKNLAISKLVKSDYKQKIQYLFTIEGIRLPNGPLLPPPHPPPLVGIKKAKKGSA